MPWGFRTHPVVVFQVLDTRGRYPTFSVLTATHSFFVSDALVWSAVVQPPLPDPQWEPAEVYTLSPEEIKLYSAIFLSEKDPYNRGFCAPLYHRGEVFPASDVPLPLNSNAFLSWAESRAAVRANDGAAREQARYRFHPAGSEDEARRLLARVDGEDQLLLAGLARLLSNLRLSTLAMFEEEELVQSFLSLGAALEYIRLGLTEQTGLSASYDHVYEYIAQSFPEGEDAREFLEVMYELRVIATHPASRFGEYWLTPMMASWAYGLRKALMELYRHIILADGLTVEDHPDLKV